jgi:hypothetical protein
MGRKKRGNNNAADGSTEEPVIKKPKPETGESYLVKKYRPEKHFVAVDAFVKYTKSHRMLDAAYVRWRPGQTAEKPFVFSVKVGGVELGWGRGKTRDAAIDCAVRAAFALVGAHGYKNFPLDADCLMEAPVDLPPPPPPPPLAPPLPGGGFPGMHHVGGPQPPPYPPHFPPPPMMAFPPPLPPGAPPLPAPVAIPQPQVLLSQPTMATSLSVPTAVSNISTGAADSNHTTFSLNLSKQPEETKKTQLKGGLTLVYSPELEGTEDEISMEEKRASLGRYQKILERIAKPTA